MIYLHILLHYLFMWAPLVAQLVKNLLATRRPGFHPCVGKIPWRRERLPTPVFRPGEFRRLYSPWACKESDMTEPFSLDARGISPGGYKRSHSPKIWHHLQDRQSKDLEFSQDLAVSVGCNPHVFQAMFADSQRENCQAKFSVHK